MKYTKFVVLFALLGACSDGTGPEDSTRYDLVELAGQPLPIQTTTTSIEFGTQGPVCQETLHSEYLELTASSSAVRVIDRSKGCDGATPVRTTTRQHGTYTQNADTMVVTIDVGGVVGNLTTRYAIEGDRLIFRAPVYTESDPDGTSGQFYTVAVYRKR